MIANFFACNLLSPLIEIGKFLLKFSQNSIFLIIKKRKEYYTLKDLFIKILTKRKRYNFPSKKKRKFVNYVTLFILSGFFILTLGYQIIIHTPLYNELQEYAYDTLSTIDKGEFRLLSNTKILDDQNQLIGEVDSGSYVYHDISDIPLNLQNAYIAAEDQNFKSHHGVDYKAILRAAFALVKNGGEITQGGSTITQQVIKNNLLTQEQSFMRKILEIMMAPEIEKEYSKQEIMEFYCNSNYYGNGCYGVGSASLFYFGKDVSELTLAECAMMAGISNSPNNYNPVADFSLARKKMKQILNQMLEQSFITEKEYDKALKQEIVVTQTRTSLVGSDNYMSSYAIHCATIELMEMDDFEFQYTFDSEEEYSSYQAAYNETYKKMASIIRSGGYTIHTSFNVEMQNKLQETVDSQLAGDTEKQKNGKFALQCAAVTIDNQTGYITAIVGGRGVDDQFNRAFLAERQPGSTIKPILVYGPAFDRGISSPSMIYVDEAINISGYSPQNSTKNYLGEMNVRQAIARSINTIPVKLLNEISPNIAISYLEKMKFSTLQYADSQSLSIALGGFNSGVRVDEMAKAYATIANQGMFASKSCIRTIEHEKDGIIYQGDEEKSIDIYNQDTAFMLTDCMEGVIYENYGTGYGINLNGQIAAVKTGTTDDTRDVWFCGYTPYYTTSVWVGRDDNASLSNSQYAKQIWTTFMNNIHAGKEIKDFVVPSSIEYRNVLSNGSLGYEVYQNLNLSQTSYFRRPDKYDLYSQKTAEQLQETVKKRELQDSLKKAEEAVSKLESYEITDLEAARGMESVYNSAISAINSITDSYQQASYKTRVTQKYERLYEAYEIWIDKIEEAEKVEEKQKQIEQVTTDEENIKKVVQKLHEQRILYMERYIELLSKREYNTSATQNLILDAQNLLNNCREYEEYENLSEQLYAQIDRISTLPTELPQIDVPENNADKSPQDYPDEKSDSSPISTTNKGRELVR